MILKECVQSRRGSDDVVALLGGSDMASPAQCGRDRRPREAAHRAGGAGPWAPSLVLTLVLLAAGCAAERAGPGDERADLSSIASQRMIGDLVFHDRGAIAFHERALPPDVLEAILNSVRPYGSLCPWKVVVATDRDNRIRVLEGMQDGYRRLERTGAADIMERWKKAPVMLVFCMPREVPAFGGVPPELMSGQAHIELGAGVQSLMLVARTYGVETHWIAGALLVEDDITTALGIPDEYRVAFFGVAGYPSEQVDQPFPPLEEICYHERWPG
jgi:nitroreductase